jgi:hypothetical protein
MSVDHIVIQKNGDLKGVTFKGFSYNNLYKKCGFRKPDGVDKRHTWKVKMNGSIVYVSVFARTEGKANTENKYDLPPPVDNDLYFGNYALVCHNDEIGEEVCDMSQEMWEKIYEVLFGGFEDLSATAENDELEVDELENVPDEYKTKSGYLKDGFVLEDSESNGTDESENGDSDGSELDFEEYEYKNDD